jgi:hypothetical protein
MPTTLTNNRARIVHTCTKCDFTSRSQQGLRVHIYRKHTRNGQKAAKRAASNFRRPRKYTRRASPALAPALPTYRARYCPVCNTDMDIINAALGVKLV